MFCKKLFLTYYCVAIFISCAHYSIQEEDRKLDIQAPEVENDDSSILKKVDEHLEKDATNYEQDSNLDESTLITNDELNVNNEEIHEGDLIGDEENKEVSEKKEEEPSESETSPNQTENDSSETMAGEWSKPADAAYAASSSNLAEDDQTKTAASFLEFKTPRDDTKTKEIIEADEFPDQGEDNSFSNKQTTNRKVEPEQPHEKIIETEIPSKNEDGENTKIYVRIIGQEVPSENGQSSIQMESADMTLEEAKAFTEEDPDTSPAVYSSIDQPSGDIEEDAETSPAHKLGEIHQQGIDIINSLFEDPEVLDQAATAANIDQEDSEKDVEEETAQDEKNMSDEEIKAKKLYEKGIGLIRSTNSLPTILMGYRYLEEAAKLDNADAQVEVAFADLIGLHRPMLIEKGAATLQKHAKAGHPRALAIVGFMHATGIGATPSQSAAILHWTFSAMAKDDMGHMMLGYRYHAGLGVENKCESALSHYQNVAAKVANSVTMSGGMVIVKIRLQDEEDNPGQLQGVLDDDLYQYYQFLADKGDSSAQVMLGQLHFQGGRGVEKDDDKALEYFKRAVENDNSHAQAYMAKIYAEGSERIEKDLDKAFELFQASAKQGNPIGQAGLGLFYKKGWGVKQDYDLALKNFKKSADQAWPEGQLHYGTMHFKGQGVTRDYKKAFTQYSQAAQNGNLLALYYLAEMHAHGVGIGRSCNTAVELYKTVCERGQHAVLFEFAHAAHKSNDHASSYAIYTLLGELGHEVAQSNAAFMLDRGQVSDVYTNSTDSRALQLWSRSAAQEYINARIKLGDYHYYGRGTPVDYDIAASHYKTAGDVHKSAQAYFNLGYMHEQGLGFKRDIHLAKRHYDLASEVSPDASAPVTIALVKITCLMLLEGLGKHTWWLPIDNVSWLGDLLYTSVVSYWDFYLITVFCCLVVSIIVFQRRRRQLREEHEHQD